MPQFFAYFSLFWNPCVTSEILNVFCWNNVSYCTYLYIKKISMSQIEFIWKLLFFELREAKLHVFSWEILCWIQTLGRLKIFRVLYTFFSMYWRPSTPVLCPLAPIFLPASPCGIPSIWGEGVHLLSLSDKKLEKIFLFHPTMDYNKTYSSPHCTCKLL